jgi:hypothetical protein
MTTKAELIAEIALEYELGTLIDETLNLSAEDQTYYANENLKIYRQIVHEQSEGKMVRKAISFYVSEEGGNGTEKAFYKDRLPVEVIKTEPVTTFRAVVEGEIATRVAADQLLRGVIREVDEPGKWALVRALREVSSEAIEEDYLVYEKNDLSIGFMIAILKSA